MKGVGSNVVRSWDHCPGTYAVSCIYQAFCDLSTHMENDGQRADFIGAPELVQPPPGTWREALHTAGRVHPSQEEQEMEITWGTGPDLEQTFQIPIQEQDVVAL